MVRCAFLGGSCLWIWTQFWLEKLDNLGTLMSASLKCEGTFKEKTKSWNGIVHVKGIWKFVSNLSFAKCRWKREKGRKEFLTWCNICIQHSINCARVQTSLFWIKDGFFLGNGKIFPVELVEQVPKTCDLLSIKYCTLLCYLFCGPITFTVNSS